MIQTGGAIPPAGVQLTAPITPEQAKVLTPDAIAFAADLARRFRDRITELLERRRERQRRFDAGERPALPRRDARIRARVDWTVAALPADLLDRRVEITGPVDRKMIINALNSGAARLHGRLRGLELAHLGQRRRGPASTCSDAVRRTIDVHRARDRQELPARPRRPRC